MMSLTTLLCSGVFWVEERGKMCPANALSLSTETRVTLLCSGVFWVEKRGKMCLTDAKSPGSLHETRIHVCGV